MKLGVVLPQTEIGADPIALRDYAQAAEALGYNHILAFEHVLGANRASRPGWKGFYDHNDPFHEPFVLFGYLAGLTKSIGFITGILILPQRQTALVAKQAAEVDLLSGGRLRLGIGIGWNEVEYEALGMNFRDRGKRSEEQIALLRALWTKPLVTFEGRWHKVTDAGINPLPIQRPIPIWIGGSADAVMERVGRIGDGWLPQFPTMDPALSRTGSQPRRTEEPRALVGRVRDYARKAGRDPAGIGIEGRASIKNQTPELWAEVYQNWRALGATHLSVNTMGAGLQGADAHIEAISRYKETVEGV